MDFHSSFYSKTYYDCLFDASMREEYHYFFVALAIGFMLWVIKFKSLFIAFLTAMILLAGLPIALIINRGFFLIDYFVEWHVLSSFIIAYIGTQNVFFIYD